MAKKSSISLGKILLQIALGALLIVGGIWAMIGGSGDFGISAINYIFKGNAAKIVKIIYGVIELIAGFFLILELFIGDKVGKFDNILNLILIIIWIIAIVFADFIYGGIFHGGKFLPWLFELANHVILLGALLHLND